MRIQSVDALRGFVMIVMALDHVRDFLHRDAMSGAPPTDLRVATAALFLIRIGAGITIAFVLIRTLNIYGDPASWSAQALPPRTLLSFLNTSKYPPSLAFLLMTLGPALLVLVWLDRHELSGKNPLVVFGRVPLFYFVLHFFLAHAVAVVMAVFTHGSAAWSFMFQPVPSMGGPAKTFPAGFGYDLWVTYVAWIAIVAALYPLCLRFARFKEHHRAWWVSYI